MANIHLKYLLKLSALIATVCLLGVVLLVTLLPTVCGSPVIQDSLKQILSRSLGRQVTWSALSVGWRNGVDVSGLKLGAGSAPLLSSEVGHLELIPSLGRDAGGRFGVGLALRARDIRAEMAPGPPPPPLPLVRDPLTRLAETLRSIQAFDLHLPVDIRMTVDLEPVTLRYRTAEPDREVRFNHFSFHLAMPSLVASPVTASLTGMVVVNGRPGELVECRAKVSNLVSGTERVSFTGAELAVTSLAPGTSLTLSGSMGRPEGFVAHGAFNLPLLQGVLAPFLSAHSPKMGGELAVTLHGKVDAQRNLQASLLIDGKALLVTGYRPHSEPIGPLNGTLQQRFTIKQGSQHVDFPDGRLQLPGVLDVPWHAFVDHPAAPGRALEVMVGPATLDIGSVATLLEPLFPPTLPVTDVTGLLSLRSLQLRLAGTENKGELTVKDLAVKLPRLEFKTAAGVSRVEDLFVALESGTFPLSAALPVGGGAELRWRVTQALLAGKEPLTLQGAGGTMSVNATDVNVKSTSPRHVAATVAVTQKFDLDRGSVGRASSVRTLHEQVRLTLHATPRGELLVAIPEFLLTAASLQVNTPGKKTVSVPVSAAFSALGVTFSAVPGVPPTVERVTADVWGGDAVRFTGEGSRTARSPDAVASHGIIHADLKRLLPLIAPFVPVGVGGEGNVTAEWSLAAPLTKTSPVSGNNPLQKVRNLLSQFEAVACGFTLDAVSAVIPTATGEIKVSGLHTTSPVRFVASSQDERLTFGGTIGFDELQSRARTGGKFDAQHGMVHLAGQLQSWKELNIREEILLEPFAVRQEGELNVSRIDSLFDEQEPFATATLARRLDAILFTTFDGTFSPLLTPVLPGLDLAGHASGNIRIDVNGGRDVAFGGAVKAEDFGARLANGTLVEGIHADVVVNRLYELVQRVQKDNRVPLSASLVRPPPVSSAVAGAADLRGRIRSDLRGDVSGSRSFTIRRVSTKVAGAPLELTSLEGDLLFSREKSGLGFFQADLLGGTIVAHGVVDLVPEMPVISASGSFSHLDLSRMQGKPRGKMVTPDEAEISGDVTLTAPVTPEQRDLFEQLTLGVTIRTIGTQTLEQLFYALDPSESNEQMVAQLKLLRMGSLKGLRAIAADGAFSLEGEAQIKGVTVQLPKVERLRISELAHRQETAANRTSIMALRSFLDVVRADTLVIGQRGDIVLKRRNYAQ